MPEDKKLTSRFAHLLGFGGAQAKAEDDDKKPEATDDNDEDDKKPEASDDEQREGESDEDYEKRMNSKKAEDDTEKEKAATLAERARCAAIFQCKEAALRPDVAAHLAFNTDHTAKAAIDLLKVTASAASPKGGNLASRMANIPTPKVGASAPDTAKPSLAANIVASYNKANQMGGKK